MNWRGGALVQLGPTPTEPLGTQNFARSCASLLSMYLPCTRILALKRKLSSGRHCRSLHTQLRRLAHHATALPASAGVRTALGWLLRAGSLLPNTVSLDISFSSREHVTRCSLGRATRWACSVRFSGHTSRSNPCLVRGFSIGALFSTRVGGHARADLPPQRAVVNTSGCRPQFHRG